MVVSIRSRLTDSKIAGPTHSKTAGMAHSAVLPERVGPTIATDVTSPERPGRRRPVTHAHTPAQPLSGTGSQRCDSVATSRRPHEPSTSRPGTGRRTSSGPQLPAAGEAGLRVDAEATPVGTHRPPHDPTGNDQRRGQQRSEHRRRPVDDRAGQRRRLLRRRAATPAAGYPGSRTSDGTALTAATRPPGGPAPTVTAASAAPAHTTAPTNAAAPSTKKNTDSPGEVDAGTEDLEAVTPPSAHWAFPETSRPHVTPRRLPVPDQARRAAKLAGHRRRGGSVRRAQENFRVVYGHSTAR